MKTRKSYKSFLKSILFWFLFLNLVASKAQLSGTYHIPSDYSTLATAIEDLNSQGVSTAVTIVVDASNPQTAPIGGYVIGGAGSALLTSTSALNAVTINGGGNTVTAFSPQTAGILNDAIFKLIGADYITLNGFTMIENPSNSGSTAAASQIRTEFGVALFYVSTTDGSQHNTITNNDISLNRTYQNSFGIFSTTRTNYISPLVVAEITNATGSNSFNNIYSNTIHNVNMGVCLIGSGAPTAANAMDNGNNIGALGFGNSITDWGNDAAMSAYPSVGYINAVTTTAGIYTNYQYNLNISYNTLVSANIIQTSTRAVNGICDNYAIALSAIANITIQPTGTIYKNINNNTVTVTNTPVLGASGNNEMIQTAGLGNAANSLATATYSISNNLILNCSILGPGAGGIFWRGIRAAASCGTITMDNNTLRGNINNCATGQVQLLRQSGTVTTDVFIRNNKFGDATGPCITFTDSSKDAHFGIIDNGGLAATLHTITGNDFQNTYVEVKPSSGADLYVRIATIGSCDVSFNTFTNNVNMKRHTSLISSTVGIRFFEDIPTGGHAVSTTVKWNNNSIVGTFKNTGNISDFRIYTNAIASPTAPSSVIEENNNNNFSNITLDTVSGFFGWINSDGLPGAGPKKTASGNTFSNWNIKSGSVNGLLGVSNSDINYASNNVINNTITNITSHDGSITGIISASGSQNFVGNTISGLSTTGASVKGIDLQAGNNQNIKKNKICDLETNNVAGFVTGIKVNGLSSTEISNNIIGDLRTPVTNADSAVKGISIVGTSLAKVYNNTVYLSGTSSGVLWGSSDIMVNTTPSFEFNNNIFINTSIAKGAGKAVAFTGSTSILSDFANTSDRNDYNATTIYTDGTNTFNSFGPYATFVGVTREAHSFSQTPPFLSTTCGDANFLHINTLIQTRVESGGTNIANVTDDFDGNSRNASTPDIGADEFSGISPPPCTGAPAVGSITGSGFLCSGYGTILILSGASTDLGITYQWNSGTTQGGPYPNVLETGTYQATGPLTVPTYYKVTITCTNLGGSSATTVEKAVLINALPAVTILPTSGLICLPGAVPISLSAGGALTYSWSPVQGLSPIRVLLAVAFLMLGGLFAVGLTQPQREAWFVDQLVSFAPARLDSEEFELDFDKAVINASATVPPRPLFVDFTGVFCTNC